MSFTLSEKFDNYHTKNHHHRLQHIWFLFQPAREPHVSVFLVQIIRSKSVGHHVDHFAYQHADIFLFSIQVTWSILVNHLRGPMSLLACRHVHKVGHNLQLCQKNTLSSFWQVSFDLICTCHIIGSNFVNTHVDYRVAQIHWTSCMFYPRGISFFYSQEAFHFLC